MEQNTRAYLSPGTKLDHGRYLIQAVLGAGGFGVTYLGLNCAQNFPVAIKEYFPNSMAFRDTAATNELLTMKSALVEPFEKGKLRFLKEAQNLARFLEEPGIVSVLDYFEENRTAYMVMEYLDGMTLEKALAQQGKFPIDSLLQQMEPLFDSLERIHKGGLIHRDISPDNIMVTKSGKMVLMDFGAARVYNQVESAQFSVVLKLLYAPLEQYNPTGQGPWTDIYALCATIYHCITGQPPLPATLRAERDRTQWPSQLGIPIAPQQEAALQKGMHVQRDQRFQSIGALKQELYGARKPRRPWLRAVGCAAAVLAIAGAALLWTHRETPPEPPAAIVSGQEVPPETVPAVPLEETGSGDLAGLEAEDWRKDPCEIILSGSDMTDAEYEAAAEILEGRLACFTGGAYSLEKTDRTLLLQFSKDDLCGKKTADILRNYLTNVLELFAFDGSGVQDAARAERFALARSDLESVTLHTGHLPGVDAASLGIEMEEYEYIEIVLTAACAEAHAAEIASWGSNLTFGLDLETSAANGQGIFYYYTVPSADGSRFYLVNDDTGGPFSALLVWNLTHDPLPQAFTFQIVDDCAWETPEDSAHPGANQLAADALAAQASNLVTLVYEYNYTTNFFTEFDPESEAPLEPEAIETALKLRFDTLQQPYAFGKSSGRENSYVFQTSADHISRDYAALLCTDTRRISLRSGLISVPSNVITTADVVAQSDGSYALRLRLGSDGQRDSIGILQSLTETISAKGGGPVYLMFDGIYFASRQIDAPVSNGCLYFDHCCLANLDHLSSDQKFIFDLAALLCSEEKPLKDMTLSDVVFSASSPAVFGLPESDALAQLPGIAQRIRQVCPDARVAAKEKLLYAVVDLPVDGQLPEAFAALAREILEASGLEDSVYDGLCVMLGQNTGGGTAQIAFLRYCSSVFYPSDEPLEDGDLVLVTDFQGGDLTPYAEAFAQRMQTDPFYASTCKTIEEIYAEAYGQPLS